MQNPLKNELRNIISGKIPVRHGAIIQTIAGYLNHSAPAGSETENTNHFKEQEAKRLEKYISEIIYGLKI